MAVDDVGKAVGMTKSVARKGAGLKYFFYLIYALTFGVVATLVVWMVVFDEPSGGDVMAQAKIVDAPAELIQQNESQSEPADDLNTEPTSYAGQATETEPTKFRPRAAARPDIGFDEKLMEVGKYGYLPMVGPEGERPADVYAQPVSDADDQGVVPYPIIAIVVTGLGKSSSETSQAIEQFPPQITFAFSPYGVNLKEYVSSARLNRHELLLELPFEPFDYPNRDTGPHTLLADAKWTDTLDKLNWLLARFPSYAGILTLDGNRLLGKAEALKPILQEVEKRGLYFADASFYPDTASSRIAEEINLDVVFLDREIDLYPSAEDIDQELFKLEALALEKGYAVGRATALPITMDRIRAWQKTLADKQIVLVPLSAVIYKIRAEQELSAKN